MYFSSWLLRILRYGFPYIDPCRYSSLPVSMPLTMKSRPTPYSAFAVTSLRVAPFRFHSPYSAIATLYRPNVGMGGCEKRASLLAVLLNAIVIDFYCFEVIFASETNFFFPSFVSIICPPIVSTTSGCRLFLT